MGLLESSFLQGLVTIDELEPKADNCTKVCVRKRDRDSFPVMCQTYCSLYNFKPTCVCEFVGAGVAHTDRKTQDEERGGAAGSGIGLRSCRGGLRKTHTHTQCKAVDAAYYIILHCKYCKQKHMLEKHFSLASYDRLLSVSGSKSVYIE